jgi:hypothetical protein
MVEVHDAHLQILDVEVVDDGSKFAIHGNYRNIGMVMVDFPWTTTLNA